VPTPTASQNKITTQERKIIMPTGYTVAVQDGKITELSEFTMQCARQFGALITMRDDPHDKPIPTRFEPQTSYYDELIAQAQATLSEVEGLSEEACARRALQAHADALDGWRSRTRVREEGRARYEAMISKVEAWTPPTPDHVELKSFMLSQLHDSIQHDCSGSYDHKPQLQTGAEWREAALTSARRDLAYGEEERRKEIECVTKRNEWVADLRDSLGGL
jgi:hypothetical protein